MSDESATAAGPSKRSRKAESQQRGRQARLTGADWVAGGLALLSREGVGAIRIPRLCAELGVTKGSFYWHFDDVDQLIEAMADRWAAEQAEAVRALGAVRSVPVEQRIENMTALLIDQRTWLVDASVREWARTDEKVAAAVQALEQTVFGILQQAMSELGFDAVESRVRAGAMVYLGIGLIHGRDSLPVPTEVEVRSVVDLLLGR